jgi:tetratricopeptide (TPR) repeat protein
VAKLGSKPPYHPLIYSYLKKYQDDPTSRVFAPLAEAYRKVGLVDEALEIAREGVRIHPGFVGGRVALARALFDKKRYQEVADELTAVVQDVPDNLIAQRLLAEASLILGKIPEALAAYKMLLYFVPHDRETAGIVEELEARGYEKGTLTLRTDPVADEQSGFSILPAGQAIQEDPRLKKSQKIKNIELLQTLLQRVERYRTLAELSKEIRAS